MNMHIQILICTYIYIHIFKYEYLYKDVNTPSPSTMPMEASPHPLPNLVPGFLSRSWQRAPSYKSPKKGIAMMSQLRGVPKIRKATIPLEGIS